MRKLVLALTAGILGGCTQVSVDVAKPDGTSVHASYISTRDIKTPAFSLKRTGENLEAAFSAEDISASNPLAAGAALVEATGTKVLDGVRLGMGAP